MALPQEQRYHILADLSLPHPSIFQLSKVHKAVALSLQKDLQILQNRDLRKLNRPFKSLATGYDEFKVNELRSWRQTGQKPALRDTFVRPSGSLEAPLAHHLHQPSYTTVFPEDDAETADKSNGCTAMILGNLYSPETLLFDHLHRRSKDCEGLEGFPKQVLKCHEDYTKDIGESMLAKVVLLYGDKVRTRILGNCKFTPLPLWGPFEGVILFLAHEENYRNADSRYKFRRILLFVSHPQSLLHEAKGSPNNCLHDKIHVAASKMTGLPVNEFYFRRKEWQKVVSHPRSMVLKEQNSASRALPHSGPEVDSELRIIDELEAEMTDHQIDEAREKARIKTCLQVEPTSFDFPRKIECGCLRCVGLDPSGPEQVFVDENPRWTLHIDRPLYVERRRFCATSKVIKRFVPIKAGIPSVQENYLRSIAQKYQQFDNDTKTMLLDCLIPSSRRPKSARGNPYDSTASFPTRDSTAKTSSDKGTHAALESTLKSSIAAEDAGRVLYSVEDNTILSNLTTSGIIALDVRQRHRETGQISMPIGEQFSSAEIESDESRERKRSMASDVDQKRSRKSSKTALLPMQSPPHGAEQDHHGRKRRKKRDLATVDVEDMDAETRYGRLRILRGIVERGGQLPELERAQLAELEGKGTRTKLRDLSKLPVADMNPKTKKSRRDVLQRKIRNGQALNDLEKAQWEELSDGK